MRGKGIEKEAKVSYPSVEPQKKGENLAKDQSSRLRETLKSIFPDRLLRALASESGFVQRARKVDPVSFFWALVLGFGVGSQRTIAGLRRVYIRSTGTTLVPSAFYDRFTDRLVSYLQSAVEHLLSEFQASFSGIGERYSLFKDLFITDSTVLKLHDALAKVFPGCRTNHSPAAAKLHVVMSVKGAGRSTVALTSERVHDSRKLRIGPWVKDRLLLFDLGYYRYQLFSCIARNGGYFLTRVKENANPLVTEIFHGLPKTYTHCELQDILGCVRAPVIDAEVELQFQKRVYGGKRSTARERFRLVAIRDEEGKYHCYVTNIPVEILSAKEIENTYRARWEIELLFKELKSGYRLDHLDSKRVEVVQALIYSAILTLLVSRRLLRVVAASVREGRERITVGRWWRMLQAYGQEILLLILRPPREIAGLRGLYKTIVHELVDPHTNRRPLLVETLK